MAKPSSVPEWASGEDADIDEPSSGKKEEGYSVGEKPSAAIWNWRENLIYQWIVYLRDIAGEAFTWTNTHVFQKGVTVTQSTSNGNGLEATGNGTGTGVKGSGGPTNAIGVEGVGSGTGVGVKGSGGSIGGEFSGGTTGVKATGSTQGVLAGGPASSYGVDAEGAVYGIYAHSARDWNHAAAVYGVALSGTAAVGVIAASQGDGAPLRIIPRTTTPSSLVDGDVWIRTDNNTICVRINGATKTFSVT